MIEQNEKKFRISRDECNDLIIPCRCGHIYEHGPRTLGIYQESSMPERRFNSLARMWPALRRYQMGDTEFIALFEQKDAREMTKFLTLLGAERRRKTNPATLRRMQATSAH